MEKILHLPPTTGPAILIADLQPIAGVADWGKQRRLWRGLESRKKIAC